MPPYPTYNEVGNLEPPIPFAASILTNSQSTHSSTFPIERQVILSCEDKNSKIPILNDYMKKASGIIAPDVPSKQTAAWIYRNSEYLKTNSHTPTLQHFNVPESQLSRKNFHTDDCNWESQTKLTLLDLNTATQKLFSRSDPKTRTHKSHTSNIEYHNTKLQSHVRRIDYLNDTTKRKNKNLTKTYHAIKCVISSKFKNIKDKDTKLGEESNCTMEDVKTNVSLETYAISNALSNIKIQEECDKEVLQNYLVEPSHLNSQNNIQQYQSPHMLHMSNYAKLDKSQKVNTKDIECYEDYFGKPSIIQGQQGNIDMNCMSSQELKRSGIFNSGKEETITRNTSTHFSTSHILVQPHLLKNKCITPDDMPKLQMNKFIPESQVNLTEIQNSSNDKHWESSGFLKPYPSEINLKDCNIFDDEHYNNREVNIEHYKRDANVDVDLQGSSRKKLETEIGNIQGVYSVGLRMREKFDSLTQSASSAIDYEKRNKSLRNADCGCESPAFNNGERIVTHSAADAEKYPSPNVLYTNTELNDSEWVDIVEGELKNILKPRNLDLSENITNSTISESMSSITPPLPPLDSYRQSSPNVHHHNSTKINSLQFNNTQRYEYENISESNQTEVSNKRYSRFNQNFNEKGRFIQDSMLIKEKKSSHRILDVGLDNTDITNSTTRSLDIQSIRDAPSDSDGEPSYHGVEKIKKQLEGLEGMYTEVLKLLGVKKSALRYQPSDPHFSKRRYGSISSLPTSSVSSRPIKDKRRSIEDRKKVRDMKGINKRFQRLESHVVTLARSVAHLSSEMRTQHLMIQEIENIRSEMSILRTYTNMLKMRSQSTIRTVTTLKKSPAFANPERVKKLTKFFGDEPPLLRLFLRSMGYERYAPLFDKESIGMIELPYLSEERLQKLGVPLGPRLRIMEEAHITVFQDNTLCIV